MKMDSGNIQKSLQILQTKELTQTKDHSAWHQEGLRWVLRGLQTQAIKNVDIKVHIARYQLKWFIYIKWTAFNSFISFKPRSSNPRSLDVSNYKMFQLTVSKLFTHTEVVSGFNFFLFNKKYFLFYFNFFFIISQWFFSHDRK